MGACRGPEHPFQERLRARLALDLHDGVNQLIIGAMFKVTAARERLREHDLEGADRSLDQVRSILAQMDEELRRIIVDIRPPPLDDHGLAQSIDRYVEQFQAQTGISCASEVRGEPLRLPDRLETGVYRILQESLSNVLRHSGAQTARVILDFSSGWLKLTVVDTGRGFDPLAMQRAGHLALSGLQERAASLGGTLRIASDPGRGTTISLCVPIHSAPGES